MDSPLRRRPSTIHSSEPHVPLRKASARQLRSRQSAPRPLFATSPSLEPHRVRGFSPSPVQPPMPGLADLTASNEHAFAGRDENRRRPFNLPLAEQLSRSGPDMRGKTEIMTSGKAEPSPRSRPPSSPLVPSPSSPGMQPNLRARRSFGDGLKGLRNRFSQSSRTAARSRPSSRDSSIPPPPNMNDPEIRDSFRSAMTSNSSFLNNSSVRTEHSSWTGRSSASDFNNVSPQWPSTDEMMRPTSSAGTDQQSTYLTVKDDDSRPGSMTVEDAIGMYEDGFESTRASMDIRIDETGERPGSQSSSVFPKRPATGIESRPSVKEDRPSSQPGSKAEAARHKKLEHRRSQSASLLLRAHSHRSGSSLKADRGHGRTPSQQKRTFSQILAPKAAKVTRPTGRTSMDLSSSRDRYGFKKVSHYVSIEQYDAWNLEYSEHLDRRTKKWQELMDSYGLSTEKAFRFPPKSDKIKRYVRKGIPPDLRGAAWFWYAGGPSRLAKEPGLYFSLLEQVKGGKLSDNDREHIERDLNRTFPDNVRFKPDPAANADIQADAGGGATTTTKIPKHVTDPETPILCALRRVLQAFAVHNPSIGYCQSLNFIAGLLLLFLDEDEEKAFVLLEIVTSVHLPGTHGVALEGANVDIAVLMSCIKESLPTVWAKLDDKQNPQRQSTAMLAAFPPSGPQAALRLPTVSLATTAWFMSLFVGTLPIEAVLRVWDCLFFEGSKTLFRIGLAIFRAAEPQIVAVQDPMEIFQLVQTVPRAMLDVNTLLEVCFRRRGGFGHVSQEIIERRRAERRQAVKEGVGVSATGTVGEEEKAVVWKRLRAKTRT